MLCSLIKCESDKRFLLKNNSIDLIVTSPPYWQLKDYQTKTQIGLYDTFNAYLYRLQKTWSECKRVLKPGCYIAVVTTDLKTLTPNNDYKIFPINAATIVNMSLLEFVYEGSIIWRKIARNGTVPSIVWPPLIRFNYEMIHIFRKGGFNKFRDRFDNIIDSEDRKYLTEGIIWTANPKQKKHPAAYPIEIPKRLLTMFSFPNDKVLDPFVGTGTTGVACEMLYRNFMGFDNNDYYLRIAYANIESKNKILCLNDIKQSEIKQKLPCVMFPENYQLTNYKLKII